MWYVLVGHMSGSNFAHCELYGPDEYENACKQAKFWLNIIKYNTVKILKMASRQEAELKMQRIDKGW